MISIHALREEGDLKPKRTTPPTPISIHALREEGDRGSLAGLGGHSISIHALREEGDLDELKEQKIEELFLSTPSARRATASRG